MRDPAGGDWILKAYELAFEMGDEVHINTADLYQHWFWFYLTEDYSQATVDHLEDMLVYFDKLWQDLLARYELQDNKWMKNLYDL